MGVDCSTQMEMCFIAPLNLPWPRCIHFNSSQKCQCKGQSLLPVDGQQLLVVTNFVLEKNASFFSMCCREHTSVVTLHVHYYSLQRYPLIVQQYRWRHLQRHLN
ncbi:hypothetical protein AVEN_151160-1 [Araneus ventricosus]|uniref:Uncharacterized protein n=1 Tax=Araneus ventricosus TaxID=182803 RepID=A0A4Y2MR96_ARAVE|nr:hypothetical protein AVEN_151160-1 [Araneus ventricosus]